MPRDHPRMCGEHASCPFVSAKRTGSSPHVRGALREVAFSGHHVGIIPACAGSTISAMIRPAGRRDHPRMCGEHTKPAEPSMRYPGSSPHVRGARVFVIYELYVEGIIPACAGSTGCRPWLYRSSEDHPRMCGEHSVGLRSIHRGWGSSPHVRGAPPSVFLPLP